MRLLQFFVFACAVGFAGATSAKAGMLEISWDDLRPAAIDYENPFEDLTADQIDSLRQLLRLQPLVDAQDADAVEKAAALREQLTTDGMDPDWLFAQREAIIKNRRAAATNTNDALLGEDVMLPGYVLPLEFNGQKVVEFLLVPTVGACIHTPPPPANQMIHVTYPDGIEVNGLFNPVWISGRMQSELSQQMVSYVDGQSAIDVTYTMTPDKVEPYKP